MVVDVFLLSNFDFLFTVAKSLCFGIVLLLDFPIEEDGGRSFWFPSRKVCRVSLFSFGVEFFISAAASYRALTLEYVAVIFNIILTTSLYPWK